MRSSKRNLNIVALLLAITLVFAQAVPAFAQEVPGSASIVGTSGADDATPSNAQTPVRDSGDPGLGGESVKCACPTTGSGEITHLTECPFYAAECICTEKCIPADIENGVDAVIDPACPVCGAEDADLSRCKGVAATPPEDGAPVPSLAAAHVIFLAEGDVTIDETNFPDANFRAWLKNNENIGSAGSDSVLTPEEIAGITQIYMARQGIRDLTGIELFTSLTALMCAYDYNPFTVPNGLPDSLTSLFFMGGNLTALPDLPSGLDGLNCSENKLTELPPLPATLKGLDCSNNALIALDLTGLTSLNTFKASGQTSYIALLSDGAGGFEAAIELNNPTFGNGGISYGDGKLKSSDNTIKETTFTVQTGKEGATLSGTLHLSYPAAGSIEINATNFPDANFRAILKSPDVWSGIEGLGKDGYLSPEEIAEITYLYLNNQGISDFTGIALFTALKSFDCSQNALVELPTLPDSLEVLLCDENKLTALPALPSGLEKLYCFDNKLAVLPTLPNSLIGLDCSYNPLTTPPVLPVGLEWLFYAGIGPMLPTALPTTLTELDYSDNGLTTLDLSGLNSLYYLNCSDNNLTELDLSGLGSLNDLGCSGNRLTTLDLSGLSMLEELHCAGNLFTTLDLSSLAELEELNCSANWLTELNVSGFDSLFDLNCAGNSLTTLDLSGLETLFVLNCSGNLLTELDLAGLSSLLDLNCSSNHLTALDLSNFSSTDFFDLQVDDQTPRLALSGSDATGYSAAIALNNPSGWATGISYAGGVLKSTSKAVTSTPFSVDTGLAERALSGTLLLTYGGGGSGTIPSITTATLPGGIVGVPYSQALAVTGDAPVTWMLDGGNLPTGLMLTGNTISGTPTVSSTFNFTVKATDSAGSDTKALSIIIVPAPPSIHTITASAGSGGSISPSGAVSVMQGGSQTFTITANANYRIASVTVDGVNQGAISSYTFTNVTGSHTISASFTYTGGGGSSGSGSPSDGTKVIIQPDKKPDQPVTAAAPVTAIAGANGSASATIPDKAITDAIAKAQSDARAQGRTANGICVALNLTMPQGATSLSTTLSQNALQSLVKAGASSLEINGAPVSLSLDLKALQEIQKQSSGNVTINFTPAQNLSIGARTLIGTRPVYNITITYMKDGKTVNITSLGNGSATLSIFYTLGTNEAASYLFGVYVDGNGKATRIPGSTYDVNSRTMIFSTGHFSVYGVGYTAPSAKFTDISTHWAKESIDYVVGRGLFNGTTDTAFAPDTAMTSGMLVTALGRLAGADVSGYKTSSFSDLKAGSAFQPYIEWAYKKGIVGGIGSNQFAPDRAVPREEMAVILTNYAKANGYKLPVTRIAVTFTDNSSISAYAEDAVKAMQQAGILMGEQNNKFNPKANTTRAEVAATLHRYIKLTIDPSTAQGWAKNDDGQFMYYKDGGTVTGD